MMVRTFKGDLQHNLKDPEFAAYFAEAQIESARELLRTGVIKHLTVGSMDMAKTEYTEWGNEEKSNYI